METSVTIPDDVADEVKRVADALKESTATVVRLALRAGLPALGPQAPRPDGYFASAYDNYPEEWAEMEAATAKGPQPEPE